MRINRQTLQKAARETVKQRVRDVRTILAVYMHGSLNHDADPFLGSSADVDVVIIHEYDPGHTREIVALTEDVTLDISHHVRTDYRAPRELRTHRWLGPSIYNFSILHDPRHFLEFTQASLRDQFYSPSNVLSRAQAFAGDARQAWLSLLTPGNSTPESVEKFLRAAGHTANAIASLYGDPMPERRLLAQFFDRTAEMGQPGLYTGLLELLGAGEMSADDLNHWSSAWDGAYAAACSSSVPAPSGWGLKLERKNYYRSAFDALMQSARPTDALWTLLITWAKSVQLLAPDHPARMDWEEAMRQIGLYGPGAAEKIGALDQYLDLIEETLEAWGKARGVEGLL